MKYFLIKKKKCFSKYYMHSDICIMFIFNHTVVIYSYQESTLNIKSNIQCDWVDFLVILTTHFGLCERMVVLPAQLGLHPWINIILQILPYGCWLHWLIDALYSYIRCVYVVFISNVCDTFKIYFLYVFTIYIANILIIIDNHIIIITYNCVITILSSLFCIVVYYFVRTGINVQAELLLLILSLIQSGKSLSGS